MRYHCTPLSAPIPFVDITMAYKIDPRNKDIMVIVDDEIVHREKATIPIWDAGFLHGKQIWSSPRLIQGKIFRLDDHLDKIEHGIKAMNFQPPPRQHFIQAIRKVLAANKMKGATGVHIRIVWTPGTQVTASMNRKAVVEWDGQTPAKQRIIVMPEWRGMETVYDGLKGEKAIISKLYRRPSPMYADQRIHSNNQIHSSLACDEATAAGVAAALMLDTDGFVAESHASHMAIIKDGTLYTPKVRCCPPGVTRKVLLEICQTNNIPSKEDDIVPERVFDADEVMILGTMSGPISITHVDGEPIGNGELGPITKRLKSLYVETMTKEKNLFDIFAK